MRAKWKNSLTIINRSQEGILREMDDDDWWYAAHLWYVMRRLQMEESGRMKESETLSPHSDGEDRCGINRSIA